jgi:hypothetical protein
LELAAVVAGGWVLVMALSLSPLPAARRTTVNFWRNLGVFWLRLGMYAMLCLW